MITVVLNGEKKQLAATSTVQQALVEWQLPTPTFALAVNDQFVPKAHYQTTVLEEGDRVELLIPMQGG